MTTPPLHPLVVAMARMLVTECSDCHGKGTVGWLEEDCPTCGDVRRALAEIEREGGT